MLKTNLIAKISTIPDGNIIGRIGGNIPKFFLDKLEDIRGYKFFLTVRHPDDDLEYITILTPDGYDDMVDNNIYPKCSVRIFSHTFSEESNDEAYTIKYINKTNIIGYEKVDGNEFNFITKTHSPALIQDENYYYEALLKDGYNFFMQIDEDYYPDGVVNGNYIFGYGALYLYKNISTQNIIAGFWQFS